MSYTIFSNGLENPRIAIVGCGGTGGFVADDVCRLLDERPGILALVDHDRVEPHNLRRQAFYGSDVGKFKAKVLAERLSQNYGREVSYSVNPYGRELHHALFGYGGPSIIIGCVDNPSARKEIAEAIGGSQWWIDAGNGENSGQVLIGNTRREREDNLKRSFYEDEGVCTHLPLPTVQAPELLAPVATPEPVPQRDCAEAIEAGDQSPVINRAMASLVQEFLSRLLAGTLGWMAAYIDLERGTRRSVAIDPKVVARIAGINPGLLVAKNGSKSNSPPLCQCGRRH